MEEDKFLFINLYYFFFFIYLVLIFGEISVKRFQLLAGKASHNLSLESKEGVGGRAEDLGESHVFYRGKGGEISRRQQSRREDYIIECQLTGNEGGEGHISGTGP